MSKRLGKRSDQNIHDRSDALIEFASNLTFQDIPSDVVVHAKRVILDTIGCSMAGLHTPEGKSVIAAVKDCAKGDEATIWLSLIHI